MPLPNLNLDDKNFEELVEEAKKYIPIYAPEWTDHGIHDPGITLIELFAWISEMQIYYLSKITEENKASFLKILGTPINEDNKVDANISKARKDIKKTYSAITPEDYEYLVYEYLESAYSEGGFSKSKYSEGQYSEDEYLVDEYSENEYSDDEYFDELRNKHFKDNFRVKAVPDVENQLMKVIIANRYNINNDISDLYEDIYSYLDEHRIVGTPLYVGGAEFVKVSISADINIKKSYNFEAVKNMAKKKLIEFLDPFNGGVLKKGWPFGRKVFKSEINQILAKVDGVKCVQNVGIYSSSIPDNGLIDLNIQDISINSNSNCKRVDYYG